MWPLEKQLESVGKKLSFFVVINYRSRSNDGQYNYLIRSSDVILLVQYTVGIYRVSTSMCLYLNSVYNIFDIKETFGFLAPRGRSEYKFVEFIRNIIKHSGSWIHKQSCTRVQDGNLHFICMPMRWCIVRDLIMRRTAGHNYFYLAVIYTTNYSFFFFF